jgi:hypothetical protein
MNRLRLAMTAASAFGIAATGVLMNSCSSSSSPLVSPDAGKDVALDHAPHSDAAPQDVAPKEDVITDAGSESCTTEPTGGPIPFPGVESGSCAYTAGNCLGVGDPCVLGVGEGGIEAGLVTISGCDAILTNFPTTGPNTCTPPPPWNIYATVDAARSGFCGPFWTTPKCPQSCGPGASCCVSESVGFAFCQPTTCVAPLLNAPQGLIDGSMGMQGGGLVPPDTVCTPN